MYKRSQIGLAVGDIEAVQQNARLKRLAMQVIYVIATNCKKINLRQMLLFNIWIYTYLYIYILNFIASLLNVRGEILFSFIFLNLEMLSMGMEIYWFY